MKKIFILLLTLPTQIFANSNFKFDGFVDFYYAYDFNRPNERDRDYTTQPARHDEFNLNLALLGITHRKKNLEARFSFQAGTYVQANYATEPNVGDNSGVSLSRYIQDAYVRYYLNEKTHLIAGIMPSHIGYESVLSIDNYTYSRSLAADFSPYYQSGVGLISQLNEKLALETYVLNGWQNISEDDSNKAIALALRHKKGKHSFNYTNYLGNYLSKFRQFHDVNYELIVNEKFKIKALYDFGIQKSKEGKDLTFSTYNIQTYHQYHDSRAWSFRLETYQDTDQTNITTATNKEFVVNGTSVGHDYFLEEGYAFRIEYRTFKATEKIYHNQDKYTDQNQTLAFSLASKF
jgi:hypothetical protein